MRSNNREVQVHNVLIIQLAEVFFVKYCFQSHQHFKSINTKTLLTELSWVGGMYLHG